MRSFDYIIVGAGAAGCVLAHRLSADPKVSVALLEAGGSDNHPFVRMPKGLAKIMADPARIWAYLSEPEQGNAFTPEVWARGRLMGGSSSINGMMYVRGQPADFDEIAQLSSDDWSWQHIGAAYRALESHELGTASTRGDAGPLHITLPDRRSELTEAFIAAGEAMGLPRKQDVNEPDNRDAVGYASRTIWKGQRQSASKAFLDPIRTRPNLTIVPHALADKVNFEHRRAVSVSIVSTQTKERATYTARREIIIAGGAMASPGILQRSGIGPRTLLESLGIGLIQDSPDVGRNLIEHRGIIMQWKLRQPVSENAQFGGWRLLRNVLQYYATRKGPMSSASYEVGAWMRSSPQVPRPDIQFLIAPFSFDFSTQRARLETFPGMGLVGYPLRPTSRGEIHIKTTDPSVLPELRPNYCTTEHDRALMLHTVRLGREYASQRSLQRFIDAETYPGPECRTEEQVLDAYGRNGSCGYHAVGSCRMGSDERSVVDSKLRVRGVHGLRVMDTSIMPRIPAGNTVGPTMAMAWRAADLILADAAAP